MVSKWKTVGFLRNESLQQAISTFFGGMGCFQKIVGFPLQIIHFNRVFYYKPSILGYLYFLETPNGILMKSEVGSHGSCYLV